MGRAEPDGGDVERREHGVAERGDDQRDEPLVGRPQRGPEEPDREQDVERNPARERVRGVAQVAGATGQVEPRQEQDPRHEADREQPEEPARMEQERTRREPRDAPARERRQRVDNRHDARFARGRDEPDRAPAGRAEPGLEAAEPVEVEERACERAGHALPCRRVPRERREAERDAVAPACALEERPVERVEQRLGRTVRRVARAHEVLDEPAAATVRGDGRQEPDDRVSARRDDVGMLLGETVRIGGHEERHRLDAARRDPAGEQRVDPRAHGGRLEQVARGRPRRADPLRPRTAQLLAERARVPYGHGPLLGRRARLLAHVERRPAREAGQVLHGEEQRATPRLPRGVHEPPRDLSARVRRRHRPPRRDPRAPRVEVRDGALRVEPDLHRRREPLERDRVARVRADEREQAWGGARVVVGWRGWHGWGPV